MDHTKLFGRTACALAVTALVGCSGGSSDDPAPQDARISVSLMDAPVDGVTAVYVKITSMWIKPQGGPAVQLPLTTTPMTVNLMALTDTNAAILVDEAVIEPGTYEWLSMDIAAERNVRDSYVLTETGGEEEIDLRVPSGRLRLVGGFDVESNEAVRLLFDWDMRQGLVFPPGQGRYFLKPAFRMIDVTSYGRLEGTIAAALVGTNLDPAANNCATDDNVDLDEGNVVYVYSGAPTPPLDDIDGTDDPVATIEATRNSVGDYVYRTLIAPGTYTVVFTCEAGNDDPEAVDDVITFHNPINTTNPVTNTGGTTTVNFGPTTS
ncbi:MAG TPA: DUF4382 domain-containing protein [Gammaproteobacteria bacterium]